MISTTLAHDMRWNSGSSTPASAYPLVPSEISRYIIGELDAAQADFYSLELPAGVPSLAFLLASQACPGFYPQLWLIAPDLPTHTPPPFNIPEGHSAFQLEYGWSLFRDLFIAARRGPGLKDFAGLEGYLAVYAPDMPGSYVLVWQGVDVMSGTPQGWDALERFNRCDIGASQQPQQVSSGLSSYEKKNIVQHHAAQTFSVLGSTRLRPAGTRVALTCALPLAA